MMCPAPGACHPRRLRFQWTTCQPPVPSPSSTAVVLTTTSSPTPTEPVRPVRTTARLPSSSPTRCSPARSARTDVTAAVTKLGTGPDAPRSERADELLDPLVAALEGVLA